MYIKSLNVKINRQIAAFCFLLYFVGLGFYRFYIKGESQALPKWKPNKELLLKQRSILEKRDSS
ncbi:hypothetical protein CYCD_29450 [Tenuifilaceae bacterium CYCD]|nr:hypothetical protein CYCD_29450 [Tenuifilaceae bacterium CYCD]